VSKVIRQARNGAVFGTQADLEVHCCDSCGLLFGAPAEWYRSRRKDGGTFYCPNGCALSYHETELDRERKARERAENRAKWANEDAARFAAERDQAKAHVRAEKAAKTRIKRQRDREREKTAAGLCPCCEATFPDLAEHMRAQHPDYPEPD
jgi:hypothetical protein